MVEERELMLARARDLNEEAFPPTCRTKLHIQFLVVKLISWCQANPLNVVLEQNVGLEAIEKGDYIH